MKTFIALLAAAFFTVAAFAQSNIRPRPEENLTDYKARMETYFAAQKAEQGEAALLEAEGSEYNQYLQFVRFWEQRLDGVKGDFHKYMLQEAAAFNPNRRRVVAHAAGRLVPAPESIGGAWNEDGPYVKPASHVGAEGIGPAEAIIFFNPAPSHMLAVSVAGGLFYSTNGGVTWLHTGTDTQIGRSGVGTAAFHPTDFKTWFAASSGNAGDNEPMWIGYIGGIFRTTDEGVTWKQIGTQSQLGGIWNRILKIETDPSNAQRLWAATAYGLYVTTNALAAAPAWTSVPAFAGKEVYDFEVRPGNSNWLYATTASYDSNGNAVGWSFVYSNDGGATWQNVPNQPASVASATALTIEVSPAKADNLYALVVRAGNGASELYIYDFGANAWHLVSNATITQGAGHAFGVSSLNPNEIFLSEDTEGRRFRYQGTPPVITFHSTYYSGGTYHPDIEDIVSHPVNPNEVWMANHGGMSISTDDGQTWADRSTGFGAALALKFSEAESNPGALAIGTYHDGTLMTTSTWFPLWSPLWIQLQHSFCDGLRPLFDPTGQYVWHSCQFGDWWLSSDFGATFTPNSPPYSASWISDGVLNSLDPKTQYRLSTDSQGNHTVMRTFDRGATWQQIADFTTFYPPASHEFILWKAYVPKTTGDYLLVHLLEKPKPNPNNLYWSHHLYRTKIANAAASATMSSWTELPLPVDGWMSEVGFDPSNPDIVYIANGSSANFTPAPTGSQMLYQVDYTNPALSTLYTCVPAVCTDITQNLPNTTIGDKALGVERNSNGGLYFATDLGCWYSNSASRAAGGGWTEIGTGLPHTGYNGLDLNYVNNKVRVASMGRGVWEHDLVPTVLGTCVAPPPNMTGWWRFGESSGLPSHDVAGATDNAGTRIGGPATIAGKVNSALRFSGAAQYVEVPSDAELNAGSGDFSIDAWIRTTQSSGVQPIVDKRTAAPIGYSFYLVNGRVGFQMADRGGSAACSTNNSTTACTNWVAPPLGWLNLADGNWHHVAVTVKRNDAAGGRLYADGWLVLMFDPTIRNQSLDNTATLWIAGSHANSASSTSFLTGDLDEVEVFKRALSAAEVQSLFAADSMGKCFCVICQ